MPVIVGVRFKNVGKVYYFSPNQIELAIGDGVIVETARGVEFGKVVLGPKEVPDEDVKQDLKPVMRKATEKDVSQHTKNAEKKTKAMEICKEKIAKHKLPMKLIDCEYTFDGTKVIFYFTAENRVDFRELVKDLASVFKIRIELRQIGIRDEAKTKGGISPCGRACCCNQYLGDFEHVSIKMAKTQGLSLNPSKISGLCGRLMCCLSYENKYYSEVFKTMPKVSSTVQTPDGRGEVLSNNMLKKLVRVRVELPDKSMTIKEYPLEQIKVKETMTEADVDAPVDENIKDILD